MTTTADQMLNAKAVYRQLAVSEATFYRMIREGQFPPGARFGANIIRWRQSTVDKWLTEHGA